MGSMKPVRPCATRNSLLVVEGYMDVVALAHHGIT